MFLDLFDDVKGKILAPKKKNRHRIADLSADPEYPPEHRR